MYDVLVIGAGPAGITAGIYAKRAGLNVVIFYKGKSELEKAEKIDNYYGFINGVSGEELYKIGIEQAKKLGIEVLEKEIIDIKQEDNFFTLKSKDEDFNTKTVIIATGNKRIVPKIDGITEFEGRGVSYCALCDGFFYQNKDVVVIGDGDFALNEAEELKNIAKSVKILTNGKELSNNKFETITKKISKISGSKKAETIEFEDGKSLKIDGVFVAEGIAGGLNFARKIGILTSKNSIIVNENMETNIKGIYACGNITGRIITNK